MKALSDLEGYQYKHWLYIPTKDVSDPDVLRNKLVQELVSRKLPEVSSRIGDVRIQGNKIHAIDISFVFPMSEVNDLIDELASKYKIPDSYVLVYKRFLGPRAKKADGAEVMKLYKEYGNYAKVAQELGISAERVRQIINKKAEGDMSNVAWLLGDSRDPLVVTLDLPRGSIGKGVLKGYSNREKMELVHDCGLETVVVMVDRKNNKPKVALVAPEEVKQWASKGFEEEARSQVIRDEKDLTYSPEGIKKIDMGAPVIGEVQKLVNSLTDALKKYVTVDKYGATMYMFAETPKPCIGKLMFEYPVGLDTNEVFKKPEVKKVLDDLSEYVNVRSTRTTDQSSILEFYLLPKHWKLQTESMVKMLNKNGIVVKDGRIAKADAQKAVALVKNFFKK